MEFNSSYSEIDKKKEEKLWEACKPGGRKFGMEIHFVHFPNKRKLRN